MPARKNTTPYYPTLEAEIAKKGIRKKDIAECLGIDNRQFSKKINGESEFRLSQALTIHNVFFSDTDMAKLFESKRG